LPADCIWEVNNLERGPQVKVFTQVARIQTQIVHHYHVTQMAEDAAELVGVDLETDPQIDPPEQISDRHHPNGFAVGSQQQGARTLSGLPLVVSGGRYLEASCFFRALESGDAGAFLLPAISSGVRAQEALASCRYPPFS
jgi:hypothetical protein